MTTRNGKTVGAANEVCVQRDGPLVCARYHFLIAAAAYFRTERRGFQVGDPVEDWLQAEPETDAMLTPCAGLCDNAGEPLRGKRP